MEPTDGDLCVLPAELLAYINELVLVLLLPRFLLSVCCSFYPSCCILIAGRILSCLRGTLGNIFPSQ